MKMIVKRNLFSPILRSFLGLFIFIFQLGFAQKDSLQDEAGSPETPIKVKQFIIPAAMVTFGFISLASPKLNQGTSPWIG